MALKELGWEVLPHPRYSSDPTLNLTAWTTLRCGKILANNGKVRDTVQNWHQDQSKEILGDESRRMQSTVSELHIVDFHHMVLNDYQIKNRENIGISKERLYYI